MSCEFCEGAGKALCRVELNGMVADVQIVNRKLVADLFRDYMEMEIKFCPMCGEPLNEQKPITHEEIWNQDMDKKPVWCDRGGWGIASRRRKLRAEKAVIDSWMREFKELIKRHEDTTQDRNRWKARAEALERALRGFVGTECQTCTRVSEDVCQGCTSQYRERWQFDEARFAGGGEQP